MTAIWRARFTNSLTDTAIDEFDLSSPSLETRLMAAGAASASIPIAKGDTRMGRRLAALRGSAANAVYLYRNGALWWGGLLWTPTRASDEAGNPSFTFQAATFESYLARCQLRADLAAMAGVDQFAIARSFIDHLQADPNANMQFTYDTTTSGAPVRDRTPYVAAAVPDYLKMLTETATVDNGFEFAFQVTADPTTGARTRKLRLGYPTLTTGTVHRLDRPGAILSYSLPEDGTRAATYAVAQGATTASTLHKDLATLASGYPRLDVTTSYTNVTDAAALEAHATADLAAARIPVIVAAIRIRLDAAPDITPQSLGDTVKFAIEDENFPDGITLTNRIVGFTVTPPERGKPEHADLILN